MPEREKKWRIGVQHPRKKDSILTILELENEAIATSGDYQRYFEINGTRYSHIINPRTGYPSEDVPASVTVLAKDCLTADALATSIFVIGPYRGLDLVEQLQDIEALIVSAKDSRLQYFFSRGLTERIEIQQ